MKKLSSVIKKENIEVNSDNYKSNLLKKHMNRKPIKEKELSKRILQVIDLAGDIAERPLDEAQSLGFMSRLLVMVNLPYRDPGIEALSWWRENGGVILDVTPGRKKGKSIGIPYGTYPRLILAYLITQAVRTKSPEIFLGKNI